MSVLHNKVQLYYEPRYIFINISEPNTPNWNMPMNEIRFKLFKGTSNLVQFIVRNNDRKPIKLRGKELHITINDESQIRTLLHKKLKIVDADQGIVHLALEPFETINFPLGFLEFNITIKDSNGTRLISFDESQNCRGFVEIEGGVFTGPRPSLQSCNTTPVRVNDNPMTFRFYSDCYPGTLGTNNYTGLNTGAIQLENYSGRIWVMGTMEEAIPEARDYGWFAINLESETQPYMDFDNYTGTVNINFICKCYWIMFKFDPIHDLAGEFQQIGKLESVKMISFRN